MRRNTSNFVVDLSTFLAALAVVATGLILEFALLPGSGGRGGGPGKILWGLGRHDWGAVHFWAAVALGALFVLHVALHWSWVCGTARRLLLRHPAVGETTRRADNVYGIALLGVLLTSLVAFVWIAWANVDTVQPAPAGAMRHQDHATQKTSQQLSANARASMPHLRGSMTLQEIEAATGVSTKTLKEKLNLPPTVASGERIGRLGRQYGFDMRTVRSIVEGHRSR